MWFRGEFGSGHDRYGTVNDPTSLLGFGQSDPKPVTAYGYYAAVGYDIAQTPFAECLRQGGRICKTLADTEFAFRYESYENIAAENPAAPNISTLLFATKAYTAGINYYLKGDNSKFQGNYIWVVDPSDPAIGLRKVRNNVFVLNYQVMF
jgi:hypothetical protein